MTQYSNIIKKSPYRRAATAAARTTAALSWAALAPATTIGGVPQPDPPQGMVPLFPGPVGEGLLVRALEQVVGLGTDEVGLGTDEVGLGTDEVGLGPDEVAGLVVLL